MGTLFVHKEGGVGLGGREADGADVAGESLLPRPSRLLESVQGLLQQADIVEGGWVDEARRLLAVDRLLEMPMEEGVLHVQLMNGPEA